MSKLYVELTVASDGEELISRDKLVITGYLPTLEITSNSITNYILARDNAERPQIADPDAEESMSWNVPKTPMVVSVSEFKFADEVDLQESVVVVTIQCAGARVLVEMLGEREE